MLARRLLLAVTILMALSVVAALMAPPPRGAQPGPSGTPAAPLAGIEDPLEVTLEASGRRRDVEVTRGDLVRVIVRGDEPDAVEIQGLSDVRAIAEDSPAVFDLLADDPGDYPIVLIGAERTIGTLRISPR